MSDVKLDFAKMNGLLPVVIQDSETGEILMLAFQNEEAYAKTLAENEVWFFSRSKNKLWKKGATSGNILKVEEIITDCDDDSLIIKVAHGANLKACHTGKRSCFFKKLK